MTSIADNSLRPMRRLMISSAPAAVSKRQPFASLTSGIGIGHASLPMTKVRLPFPSCCQTHISIAAR